MWISPAQQPGSCRRSHYVNHHQQFTVTGGLSSSWRLIAGNLLYVLIDHLFTLIFHSLIFNLCTWPGTYHSCDLTSGANLYSKRPSRDFLANIVAPWRLLGHTPQLQSISLHLQRAKVCCWHLPSYNLIFNLLSSKSAIKALLSGCDLNPWLNGFSTLPLRNLSFFLIHLPTFPVPALIIGPERETEVTLNLQLGNCCPSIMGYIVFPQIYMLAS